MGEALCTIIGLLFIFGSVSMFMSLITDKHYNDPVKHSAIDNDLGDVIVVDQVFDSIVSKHGDNDFEIDDDLLED